MSSEMLVFAVAEDRMSCDPMPSTQLSKLGVLETAHLERWVVDHPEVLGDNIRIVTTQYNKWSSDSGDLAKERLDILGLDASGQLVVVELKRGTDSNVHMQAITYAALVAGFSKETLADAHAEYLNRGTPTSDCTPDDAAALLNEHVDGTWDDDVLTVPKIVLLAEDFTAQTYTTVTWLSGLTPTLNIEMHTVNAFLTNGGQPCVVFRRLFPTVDPSTRVLTPGIAATNAAQVATKIAEKQRRSRSTYLLHDRGTIPEGSEIDLDLYGSVDRQIVIEVEAWVSENPARGHAVWTGNRQKPLRWLGTDTDETFAPSRLTQRIISEATGHWKGSINGSDVWKWNAQSLYELAARAEESINTEPNLDTQL
ncbi:DNA-binding protein [Mycobacteroides abscessus]|uniref:DNA-binding protein n=1 Tax=Mycobacteroides abscessus TaxID=36809 RepID=UPI001F35649F|nr:DNA-binding protein [Mycobacteroides abscessus]